MKMKIYKLTFLLLSFVAITFSCKKDDTPAVVPDPEPKPTLFESIQGKWTISNSVGRKSPSGLLSDKVQDKPRFVSLEFLSDSTYIIIMDDQEVYSGKIGIADSTTINVYQFGIISDIKFSDETSLSFNISSEGWGSYTVVTTKAPEITDGPETDLICRKWASTTWDRGPATFGLYGGSEEYPLHLLITKSGTYYIKTSHFDTLYNAHSCTWKWHPSKANTLIYTNQGKDSEVLITELTDHSLKMEEDYMEQGSQEPAHQEYIFVPAE